MKPLLRLCYLSASQDPVDGRWSLVIISPSLHLWGILEQSRINIEWLKVNCFKIFSTYHMIWALFCNRFWEIYDRETSLSCMHTNCVQKVRTWLLFWIVESRQLNLHDMTGIKNIHCQKKMNGLHSFLQNKKLSAFNCYIMFVI